MTYRPGRHWQVTIIDEGDTRGGDHSRTDRLRAVVMAGKVLTTDPELAERVCALLNEAEQPRPLTPMVVNMSDADFETFRARFLENAGRAVTVLPHTPDVDYAHGARQALAGIRRQLDTWLAATDPHFEAQRHDIDNLVLGWLRTTAADLSVDEKAPACPEHGIGDHDCAEHAPPSPLSSTQSAAAAPGVGQDTSDDPSGSQAICDCGHEGLDDWYHLRPCPVAERRFAESRTSRPEDITDVGVIHLIRQDYGTTGCCHRVPSALPLTDRLTLHPDAATCGLPRDVENWAACIAINLLATAIVIGGAILWKLADVHAEDRR